MKREEIRIRDPYIVLEGDTYYMYYSLGEMSIAYYYSDDLENWEDGGVCFEADENIWSNEGVWASEVHKYKGKFYLFASPRDKKELRGTLIAVSSSPRGPFVPVTARAATPDNSSCIDGTFLVEDGKPYIIYSHDWPDNYVEDVDAYVGEICCAELNDELAGIVGEPWRIFASNEVPLSKVAPNPLPYGGKRVIRYGSDAPFVQKLSDGRLFLTWSPYLKDHYVVLGAISESGKICGPWTHLDVPVFEDDGGHAMFFKNKEGKVCMALHAPERPPRERAHIFEMCEKDGRLEIVKEI